MRVASSHDQGLHSTSYMNTQQVVNKPDGRLEPLRGTRTRGTSPFAASTPESTSACDRRALDSSTEVCTDRPGPQCVAEPALIAVYRDSCRLGSAASYSPAGAKIDPPDALNISRSLDHVRLGGNWVVARDYNALRGDRATSLFETMMNSDCSTRLTSGLDFRDGEATRSP